MIRKLSVFSSVRESGHFPLNPAEPDLSSDLTDSALFYRRREARRERRDYWRNISAISALYGEATGCASALSERFAKVRKVRYLQSWKQNGEGAWGRGYKCVCISRFAARFCREVTVSAAPNSAACSSTIVAPEATST